VIDAPCDKNKLASSGAKFWFLSRQLLRRTPSLATAITVLGYRAYSVKLSITD